MKKSAPERPITVPPRSLDPFPYRSFRYAVGAAAGGAAAGGCRCDSRLRGLVRGLERSGQRGDLAGLLFDRCGIVLAGDNRLSERVQFGGRVRHGCGERVDARPQIIEFLGHSRFSLEDGGEQFFNTIKPLIHDRGEPFGPRRHELRGLATERVRTDRLRFARFHGFGWLFVGGKREHVSSWG